MSSADAMDLVGTHAAIPRPVVMPGVGYRVLAAAIAALGMLGMVSGDFAGVWQHVPIEHLPYRSLLAYACAAIELAVGAALLLRWLAPLASGLLAAFILSWAVLSKLPGVLLRPQVEASWLGLAEITVMLAGAWIVLLTCVPIRVPLLNGPGALRSARILFALSLLPIGLSHFFYVEQTAAFVPAWLPWHRGFAWLTGAGNIAACIGMLTGRLAWLAAAVETAMLAIITVLVWTPLLTPAPDGLLLKITAFLISSAITGAAWVVADSYAGSPRGIRPWLRLGLASR